jgi:hypothetical protein
MSPPPPAGFENILVKIRGSGKINIMSYIKYYGISEEISKLEKLPKDLPIKASDLHDLHVMFLNALEKQHERLKKLEDAAKTKAC